MRKYNVKTLLIVVLTLFITSAFLFPLGVSGLINNPENNYTTKALVNYNEKFTTTTYRDAATTAYGWGLGAVSKARNFTYEHLDFFQTEYPQTALDIQGRKVYTTSYNLSSYYYSIQAFDINNPRDIHRMSFRNSVSASYTCKVDGDYLYTGDISPGDPDINIYNVRNPFNLEGAGVYLTSHNTFGGVTDIAIQGHLVYYTDYKTTQGRSLQILYTENPASGSQIVCNWNVSKALGLEVKGDFAFIAASDEGFYVLNVTDKWLPIEVGYINTPGNATDVIIDGHLAYLADGPAGFHIIDISDPSTPNILATFDTLGHARKLVLQEKTLFVADMYGGVQVFDVNNPNKPLLITDFLSDEIVYDVGLFGGILVVATNEGIHTFRVSANWGMTLKVSPNSFSDYQVWDVRVQGNIAYIAGGSDGFYTLDVSDPSQPILLDRYIAAGYSLEKLDINGQFAYTVSENGLLIFDISNPANIKEINVIPGSGLTDVMIQGELLYTSFNTGFAILNVSSGYLPSLVVNYVPGLHENITAIWVEGRHVYVVEGSASSTANTFACYDVTNFASPVFTYSRNREPSHYDIHTDGDSAYLGAGGWMSLYNVSDPTSFTYSGFVTTTSYGVWAFGPYVLSAEASSGIALYNTTQTNNIELMHRHANGATNRSFQITTHGDYTYVANRSSLIILRHFLSAGSTFIPGTQIAQSNTISTSTAKITKATLNAVQFIQSDTTIVYFLSADGGTTWEEVTQGAVHEFTTAGNDLRWKAEVTGPEHLSAYLYELTIDYEYSSFMNFILTPWLGLPVWAWFSIGLGALILIIVIIVVIVKVAKKKS
ncbi:MAG: hypothetical protein JXA54_10370 [Candidatus Heimdallarchaeota archaeon]|nr:hypothetical protein [Candidatus Heimdallarchaeota archaeon]